MRMGVGELQTDFIRISKLATALLIMLSLGAYFGESSRYLELGSHFRVHYLFLALVLILIFIINRCKSWAALSLLVIVVNAIEVMPIFVHSTESANGSAVNQFSLLLANVQMDNTQHQRLIELVQRQQPDFLALLETDVIWAQALEGLRQRYPHQKIIPRGDNFGIAIYSRLSFEKLEVIELGDSGVPSIAAQVHLAGKAVTILATHPLSPPGEGNTLRRNSQLSAIASFIREIPEAKIVIGDLNVTMWSPYFTRLLEHSGLVNTRQGHGILPTWPTFLPFLMIPLDHCLTSPDISVSEIALLPEIGSDHLPLLFRLRI
jgi:endonuclease/exonuclease/phosphatase (EEP) superfamily protein YafD